MSSARSSPHATVHYDPCGPYVYLNFTIISILPSIRVAVKIYYKLVHQIPTIKIVFMKL